MLAHVLQIVPYAFDWKMNHGLMFVPGRASFAYAWLAPLVMMRCMVGLKFDESASHQTLTRWHTFGELWQMTSSMQTFRNCRGQVPFGSGWDPLA